MTRPRGNLGRKRRSDSWILPFYSQRLMDFQRTSCLVKTMLSDPYLFTTPLSFCAISFNAMSQSTYTNFPSPCFQHALEASSASGVVPELKRQGWAEAHARLGCSKFGRRYILSPLLTKIKLHAAPHAPQITDALTPRGCLPRSLLNRRRQRKCRNDSNSGGKFDQVSS